MTSLKKLLKIYTKTYIKGILLWAALNCQNQIFSNLQSQTTIVIHHHPWSPTKPNITGQWDHQFYSPLISLFNSCLKRIPVVHWFNFIYVTLSKYQSKLCYPSLSCHILLSTLKITDFWKCLKHFWPERGIIGSAKILFKNLKIYMDCNWTVIGLPLDWHLHCHWIIIGLSLDCNWTDIGQILNWLWTDFGLTLDWHWTDIGLTLDCNWTVLRLIFYRHWIDIELTFDWHWTDIGLPLDLYWTDIGLMLDCYWTDWYFIRTSSKTRKLFSQ